ncbi:carbohydrate binding domain-containing protein [Thermopirellula anaerolimosa]
MTRMPPRRFASPLFVVAILGLASLVAHASAGDEADSGVFNGSFEQDANGDGIPDGWSTAGRAGVRQELRIVEDARRGRVARLTCTAFESGFPDSHAMLAQLDRVSLQRGQWYRLSLWARGSDIESGSVNVAIVNRRVWRESGLQEIFAPSEEWESFAFDFRATDDLAAADSRLQIYFTGTGTLYLDDVVLEPSSGPRYDREPIIPFDGDVNPVPNSSFECGSGGWGGYSVISGGWAANLFFLPGEWDPNEAYHGRAAWRLTLDPADRPISYFDYFDPQVTPLKNPMVAPVGWIPIERGAKYTVSAYVKADGDDLPVGIVVRFGNGRTSSRSFRVGRDWQRVEAAFEAQDAYAFPAVGFAFSDEPSSRRTLWVDAVQWDAGDLATPYRPRSAVEASLATERIGNIFTDPSGGLSFQLRAVNLEDRVAALRGVLTVTDYCDREIYREDISTPLPPGEPTCLRWTEILSGRKGFYRIRWQPENGTPQSLRAAVVSKFLQEDTRFGMNHAFPWQFLLDLSHAAGIGWWRDWSTQWRLVQDSASSPFRFDIPDAQIDRVLATGGKVVALLPFPSAPWSAAADMDRIASETRGNDYLRRRLLVAQKPRDPGEFAAYVRASVSNFRGRVGVIEILNEPIYTDYALPQSYGYTMTDYIEVLRTAYQAAKTADPACTVVGGIAAPPDHRFVREFIDQGGLEWCDVMNLHMYPHRGDPITYEKAFRDCRERMAAAGRSRDVWMTEIGCYADDDPATRPFRVGDSAMNRALRPNELRGAVDLVKFAAVLGSGNVTKVFYHAGTCGALNEDTAGNVFFEYGGAPRKMYAAQAALSQLLPADARFLRKWSDPPGLHAFEFESPRGKTTIAWSVGKDTIDFALPKDWTAYDLMGNPLEGETVAIGSIPVYLIDRPAP